MNHVGLNQLFSTGQGTSTESKTAAFELQLLNILTAHLPANRI